MSENTTEVPTVHGTAVPPAPAPPAIPNTRRTFRRTNNSGFSAVVAMPTTYTKETGIPPVVGATEGYRFHEKSDYTPSNYVPSFVTIVSTWYLTCQRFTGHDRFTKDTASWHPYFDLLYLSFLMMYHILRVRRRFGFFDTTEQQFLADLEVMYPPTSLHIPGTYVQIFQSITAVESPYPWQGLIGATFPELVLHLTGTHNYLLPQNLGLMFVNPLISLSLLDEVVRATRTDQNAPVVPGLQSFFTSNVGIGSAVNGILNTPYARAGNPCSPRTEHLFWSNFAGNDANSSLANFNRNWDLPRRPTLPSTNRNQISLAQFMCIVDLPGIRNRSDRLRNWPNEYSSVIALMCQYTRGSRSLNDVSEAGLGACIPVWKYSPNTFNTADPDTFTKGTEENVTLDFESCRAAKILRSLAASAISQDPEGDQLSVQYSAISQVNIDMSAQDEFPENDVLRSGPFWSTPICEVGSLYDPARLLATAVNGSISSVKI